MAVMACWSLRGKRRADKGWDNTEYGEGSKTGNHAGLKAFRGGRGY